MRPDSRGRRLAAIAIAAALFLAIAAAYAAFVWKAAPQEGMDAGGTVYQYHIAMIGGSPYDEFWASIYEGAKEAGEACGAYVENFGGSLEADYTVAELVRMAIVAQVDGIIVDPGQEDGLEDLVELAAQDGIPVMTVLSDLPNSGRISFVSGNSYALGEMYGSQILEAVQQKGEPGQQKSQEAARQLKVSVLINASNENSQQNLIYSGIRKAVSVLPQQPELSTVSVGGQGRFESEEAVRDLVLGSGCPDILVCLSAADTISAYQCVVDYNIVGKVSIIGYYSSQETLEEIRRGVVQSTISINAGEMGRTAAEGMCAYLANGHVSEYLPISSELITTENVGEYMEKGEGDE